MRATLHTMYEDEESPLGKQSDIANPAAFAALVEVACLAQVHSCDDEPVRQHIANEMEKNVHRLRRGFNIDQKTMNSVSDALYSCSESDSLEDAQRNVEDALYGSQLQKRVKVARHSVSVRPDQRKARPTSPPPHRFDDDDRDSTERRSL